jgi:Domain of unknown function (DUF222)
MDSDHVENRVRGVFDSLARALRSLEEVGVAVETRHVDGDDAARLVRLLTRIERVAVAARTAAIRRVERSSVWQKDGHRTVAEWVAATTGTSLGSAIRVVETAHKLQSLPATREAFSSGRLSEVQVREIADAAAVDTKSEPMLLEAAATRSIVGLREECRRVRAAAVPDEASAYEAIRRRRYLRTWTDMDGAVRLDARLLPHDAAHLIATIDSRRDRISAEARRQGIRESSEAFAADALVELAKEATSQDAMAPRATVHVVVDHSVLKQGRRRPDQRCEIPTVGPIPPATARALAGDSILKAIVMKGPDVVEVRHLGRTIPSHIRTALQIRDPACVVPGCDKRRGLEIDHYRVPFAEGGPSTLDNLARVCSWHHYQKTHLGYRLSGGPGAWKWEKPSDLDVAPTASRV